MFNRDAPDDAALAVNAGPSEKKGLHDTSYWLRMLVASSLLAVVALTMVTCAVLSRIDKTVVPLGAAFVTVVSLSAVIFGMCDPKAEAKLVFKTIALQWVDRCSRSRMLAALHLTTMVFLATVIALGGMASLYSNVEIVPLNLAQPERYKITTRDYLGTPKDIKIAVGHLEPVWLPFARFRGRLLKVYKDEQQITECSIKVTSTDCVPFEDVAPADYAIRNVVDNVDFRGWSSFSADSKTPVSIVSRRFDISLTRHTEKSFNRWTATSSPFPEDCVILSGNADCDVKLPGTYEPNRRNSVIVLHNDAFPIGLEKQLVYVVSYKNTFTFTPAGESGGCLNCDVTFISVYPIDQYAITMTFPSAWTWERVMLNVTVQDGSSYSVPITNETKSSEFKYSATRLPAGVHMTFLIFPDRRIPRA